MSSGTRRIASAQMGLVLIVGVLLSALVLSAGSSAALVVDGDGRSAYRLFPMSSAAASVAARRALDAGRIGEAVRRARGALRRSPLSTAAMVVLADAERRTAPMQAAALMARAAASSWRDARAQAWIASAAFNAGDFAAAAQHVDALARVQDPAEDVFPVVDAFSATGSATRAEADRLALDPIWRRRYFAAAGLAPAALGARAIFLRALMATGGPPASREVWPVVQRMADLGYYNGAHRLWLDASPSRRPGPLIDGDFTQIAADPSQTDPFGWRVKPASGASVEFEQTSAGTVQVHAQSDASTNASLLSQAMIATPGLYRLDLSARFKDPGSRNAFLWTILCQAAPGHASTIQAREDRSSSDRITLVFPVPAGDACPMIVLQLSAVTSDMFGPAEAWFGSLRLDRVSANAR